MLDLFASLSEKMPEDLLLNYLKLAIEKYQQNKSEDNRKNISMFMQMWGIRAVLKEKNMTVDQLIDEVDSIKKMQEALKEFHQ